MRKGGGPLYRQLVEGVAGEEVGEQFGRGFPVAPEVHTAGYAVVVADAEFLEVGDSEGVSRSALAPGGGVDVVAGFAAAQEGIEAVLPKTVVGETDGEATADTKGFSDDLSGLVDLLEGA